MAHALFFVLIFHISAVLSQNILCADMEPVCEDYTFTSIGSNTTAEDDCNFTPSPCNDYDCNSTPLNPTWWYFEIDATSPSGGNLDMNLFFSSDHDFVIWGPFGDVATAVATCGDLSTVVDCSESTVPPETPSIASTEPGEIYVMVITNYFGNNQSVTLSPVITSTAITDCSITIVTPAPTTPAPTTPAPTTPAPTTPSPTTPAPTTPAPTTPAPTTPAPTTPAPTTPAPTTPAPTTPAPTTADSTFFTSDYSSDDDDDESSSVDFDAAVAAVYKSDDSQSIGKGYHLNIEISDKTKRHLCYMALTAVAVNIAMCLFFTRNRRRASKHSVKPSNDF